MSTASRRKVTRVNCEPTQSHHFQYKYSYSATEAGIVGEYLVRKGSKGRRYAELFSRAVVDGENKINCGKDFPADKLIISKTRINALFLSTCAMLAVPEAEKIVDYFFKQAEGHIG